jgi:hypothetical protein
MKYLIEDNVRDDQCPLEFLKDDDLCVQIMEERSREVVCSNTMKLETIEIEIPLGTIEYTREELSKELDDLFFLRDAFLVLLNEEVANKSDIVYDKKTMLKYAKGMYMNSNYSKEFIEECFATAK